MGHGREPGDGSRLARLLPRGLGDDDGGDDAALGGADDARVRAGQPATRAGTTFFLAGYLVAWTGYGLLAFAVYRALRAAAPAFFRWDSGGRYLAGAAVAAAGLYELTPLKSVCLRQCRTPLHFVLGRWRPGRLGALRMGTEHGAYCVGCCFGLMLLLFVLGLMSLVWMVLVAALVFAEKVLPLGDRLPRAVAAALVAVGLWVAIAPATVPGLTRPMETSSAGR